MNLKNMAKNALAWMALASLAYAAPVMADENAELAVD